MPSTRSIPHMIPEVQQQTIWYSLPNGHGLWGTNMNPGHVNLFVQTLMLSSRQFTYPGIKFSTMLSPQASTICRISQNLSRYVGGGGVASVKDKAERMASNHFMLIHTPRQRGAPWKALIVCVAQNSCLWGPIGSPLASRAQSNVRTRHTEPVSLPPVGCCLFGVKSRA